MRTALNIEKGKRNINNVKILITRYIKYCYLTNIVLAMFIIIFRSHLASIFTEDKTTK